MFNLMVRNGNCRLGETPATIFLTGYQGNVFLQFPIQGHIEITTLLHFKFHYYFIHAVHIRRMATREVVEAHSENFRISAVDVCMGIMHTSESL